MQPPLTIGLTSNKIERCLTGGRMDGIGIYTTQLMRELPNYGCNITPFFYPPIPIGHRGRKASNTIDTIGTAFPLPYAVQTLISEVFHRPIKLRQHVDLFHATDYYITRMDVPVIATLHDAVPLKYPEWANARLRRLKNWLMRRTAKLADWIIAPSQFVVDDLVTYFGIDAKRISVVPCGVDPQWLSTPSTDEVNRVLQHRGLTSGYFLFVGTLQPRKNVQRIIRAYLKLPTLIRAQRSLVIVGRAGWRCTSDIAAIEAAIQATTQTASASASSDQRVYWLTDVTDMHELRCLYAGAGVFVFPSLYEGFGIPVLEAFAARVPVVTANTTALHEVSAGAAIAVDPESVDAIAEGMLALIEDTHLAAQCIERGYLRAVQHTWQHTAELTAAVYRRVV